MSVPTPQPLLSFVPEALSASQVGVWETVLESGRTRVDAAIASWFGVDPIDAARGLPTNYFVRAVLPEDRTALHDKLYQVRTFGGMYVFEFRTQPTPHEIRWLLARGRYERDQASGAMTGRGIIIDITESKLDGQVEDRALFYATGKSSPSLNHVASLALEVRQQIDELGEKDGSPLRNAIDALLWAVGRAMTAGKNSFKKPKRNIN